MRQHSDESFSFISNFASRVPLWQDSCSFIDVSKLTAAGKGKGGDSGSASSTCSHPLFTQQSERNPTAERGWGDPIHERTPQTSQRREGQSVDEILNKLSPEYRTDVARMLIRSASKALPDMRRGYAPAMQISLPTPDTIRTVTTLPHMQGCLLASMHTGFMRLVGVIIRRAQSTWHLHQPLRCGSLLVQYLKCTHFDMVSSLRAYS